ncbi:MAG TPA: enoyl-CoA hydratase [Burkholderiaceae bacterium]|nr:enoyl-CoA hydratase [Burkholderiaceae bacterium]
MTGPVVLSEVGDDGVATLTLNRPQAMNALSRELLDELAHTIDALAADARVRVLILTGAGRAFCAGLDLKELGAGRTDIGKTTVTSRGDPVGALTRCAKPVIGAINGAAVTGGFELALACDVLIASSQARFGDTHARVGLASGWGLSQKLSRAVGIYRAREISLGGRWVSAEQAAAWGFVNRVVAPGELMRAARELAADMLLAQPGMLERYKSIIDDGFALPFGQAMALEAQRARDFNATVQATDIEQRREGVRERNRKT